MGATWAAPKGGARASADVTFLGNMIWGRGLGGVSRTPSEVSRIFSGCFVLSCRAAGRILFCKARSRREEPGPVLGSSVNGFPERSTWAGEGGGEAPSILENGVVKRESRETTSIRSLVVGVILTWLRDLFSVVESIQWQSSVHFVQFNPLRCHVSNLLDINDVSVVSSNIAEFWNFKPTFLKNIQAM